MFVRFWLSARVRALSFLAAFSQGVVRHVDVRLRARWRRQRVIQIDRRVGQIQRVGDPQQDGQQFFERGGEPIDVDGQGDQRHGIGPGQARRTSRAPPE